MTNAINTHHKSKVVPAARSIYSGLRLSRQRLPISCASLGERFEAYLLHAGVSQEQGWLLTAWTATNSTCTEDSQGPKRDCVSRGTSSKIQSWCLSFHCAWHVAAQGF